MNCHDIFSYTWHLNLCYLIFDASALHRICVFFMLVVILILLLSYNGCHVWFFWGCLKGGWCVFCACAKKWCVFFASFFVIYSRQKHSTCHLYFTIQIFIMFTGNFWVFFIFYVFFFVFMLGFLVFLCFQSFFWFFCIFLIILFMFVLDWVEW